MSKVRSINNGRRVRRAAGAALASAAAALILGGCGPNVHSSSIRGTGYVRIDDVVKHHPLYPQLSQIDDAIAAINLQSTARKVPLGARQIAAQTVELNKELRDAQIRTNKILATREREYADRESRAVSTALAAAGIRGNGALAAQQMSGESARQAQDAARSANSDYMAYQQNVIAQDNAASSSIARELQTQAAAKYRAKAEQLQQNETDLALRLTQQDASARLAVKMRLSNLAMDPAARKQAESQLAAINERETAAVTAARNADAATLRAYHAQLDAQTSAQIRSQVGAIQSQTQAKLAAHRNEVTAQLRSLAPAPAPSNLPPAVSAQIAQIHKQFVGQFQAEANKTIADYNATKADLDRQFAALHGADVGATGAAAKELDSLQKRRTDLYRQIVAQVQRDAARIAKDGGFAVVFVNVRAATGGYDMTNQVIKDVESQHE